MSETEETVREIRINPIVPSESVPVATARGMRPRDAEERIERGAEAHVDRCPFCTGNEDKTPPTILAVPDEKHWEIRIVENLYPVLGDDHAASGINFGLQQAIEGYGHHEVIIDHSKHGIAIHEMNVYNEITHSRNYYQKHHQPRGCRRAVARR